MRNGVTKQAGQGKKLSIDVVWGSLADSTSLQEWEEDHCGGLSCGPASLADTMWNRDKPSPLSPKILTQSIMANVMVFIFSQLPVWGWFFGSNRSLKHPQNLCLIEEEHCLTQNVITISSKNVCVLGEEKYVRVTGRQDLGPGPYKLQP